MIRHLITVCVRKIKTFGADFSSSTIKFSISSSPFLICFSAQDQTIKQINTDSGYMFSWLSARSVSGGSVLFRLGFFSGLNVHKFDLKHKDRVRRDQADCPVSIAEL